MNPIDLLTCPITNRVMEMPVVAPCGHTFEQYAILESQYCPEHERPIHPSSLRPDLLCREITFQVLVKKENEDKPNPPHRVVLLSFTRPSKEVTYHYENFYYETAKRLGAYDKKNPIPLFDVITGQLIRHPATAPCAHTIDTSSIPSEGTYCPLDGTFILPESLYPNLFLTSYIQSILSKVSEIPSDVKGVYLDLPLDFTILDLGKIAEGIVGCQRFTHLQFSDGDRFIPWNTKLKDLLVDTPETIIPYIFAFDAGS